jgi:hypothetical protein
MTCTRSITFDIKNKQGDPVLQVKATEVNGTLLFELQVVSDGKKADLRALFFDLNDNVKMAGLTFSNAGGKVTDFATGQVNDLGNGANIKGAGGPFDVGLEFGTEGVAKDIIQSATFTLSNTANNLTLDDIAHVQFGTKIDGVKGPAKSVDLAPAAPNAVDDAYAIFEDGAAGLTSPSKTPLGTVFEVLDNDTDADGDTLTVTEVFGALHGTVTIVDGDDADLLAGDAVLYTPFLDYAGPDSFTYCISDNNGGTDFAEVDVAIEAVADVPTLTYEVFAGDAVNEIIIKVVATQNDADASEFIDRIDLSGIPGGVTVVPGSVNPGDQPGSITREFKLTLPLNQDTNFDLNISAYSEEITNGDQEIGAAVVPIVFEFNRNEFDQTFSATDQSIWSNGDEFKFSDNRFIGVNESFNFDEGSFVYAVAEGSFVAGIQSNLKFEGGEIDATVPYDITIDTNYNKTTDVLLIGGDAIIAPGASFSTEGPEGSYKLDFLFNLFLHAAVGVDLPVAGKTDVYGITLGPYDYSQNVIDIDSTDPVVTVDLPAGFSLDFAWPNVDSTSTPSGGNTFESKGESNNFLQANLDVDDLFSEIFLGGVNPFDVEFDLGFVEGVIELLDLDLKGGLNFIQEFVMSISELTGTIKFENGSSQAFDFDNDILLTNASSYDTDNDGQIEFELSLSPDATLANDTDLGINIGAQFDLLTVSGSYDIEIYSDTFSFGPLISLGGSQTVASIDVFDDTFDLNFDSSGLNFLA